MAYSKIVVADTVVTRLIEGQGIYNSANRSFDTLVKVGATSVDIPDLAIPVVKTVGTTSTDSDRKNAKAGTTMVNIPMAAQAVPLANELLAQWESDGMLINEYLLSASDVLMEYFDKQVVTAAQTGTQTAFTGSSMAWADLVGLKKRMDVSKVPQRGRVMVIDANLFDEFTSLDVVKNAIGFNKAYLETGEFPSILGFKVFVSGIVPTVIGGDAGAHYNISAFYGPGLAFILDRMGEIKERYDEENLKDVTDMLAHSGQKLLKSAFGEVIYKP